ncbi:MAG TPA: hypothetical protein VGG33_27360 [Polyangia bacterium]
MISSRRPRFARFACKSLGVGLLSGLALFGCASTTETAVSTTLVVRSRVDDGQPMAGVVLKVNHDVVGRTDERGELHARLSGRDGAMFRVEGTCPEGYNSPTELPPIVLGRFASLTKQDGEMELTVLCERQRRTAAIVVRTRVERRKITIPHRARAKPQNVAEGFGALEGVPVMINGRERAKTDASGLAHIELETTPGTHIEVVLQTGTPELAMVKPRSPSQGLTLRGHDDVYTVDQTFTSERVIRLPPPPPPPPKPKKHVIQVLSGTEAPLIRFKR